MERKIYNMLDQRIDEAQLRILEHRDDSPDPNADKFPHLVNGNAKNIIYMLIFFELVFGLKILVCWIFKNSEQFSYEKRRSDYGNAYQNQWIYISWSIIILNLFVMMIINKNYISNYFKSPVAYEIIKSPKMKTKYDHTNYEKRNGETVKVNYYREYVDEYVDVTINYYKQKQITCSIKFKVCSIPLILALISAIWILVQDIITKILIFKYAYLDSFLYMITTNLIFSLAIDLSYFVGIYKMVFTGSTIPITLGWIALLTPITLGYDVLSRLLFYFLLKK